MLLKVLVIGQGGREHAIAWNLSKSEKINSIYVAPGNGGTFFEKKTTNIKLKTTDVDSLIDFVKKNSIDLTIVGPEAPLVDGIVNRFNAEGLRIFGPTKEHARLEGSKVFAKSFMNENNLPTASSESFSEKQSATKYLSTRKYPVVIKADGLASGKGVVITDSFEDSLEAITQLMNDDSSKKVLIEEFLTGIEMSAIYICNFRNFGILLPLTKDYKSRDEYNSGPNTGGMGAITHPFVLENKNFLYKLNMKIKEIYAKTIASINKKVGSDYLGFLYIGLMVDKNGEINILEYNCRLGDPETQNIMIALNHYNIDLLDLISGVENLAFDIFEEKENDSDPLFCCTIVLASKGYPGKFKKDFYLDLSEIIENDFIKIFHSGTVIENGKIKVIGGRILSINVTAPDKENAVSLAYENMKKIKAYEDEAFTKENSDLIFYRQDIGN